MRGTGPLRQRCGVLAVRLDSTTGEPAGRVWRIESSSMSTKGATMNSQLRRSYSFLVRLLLLAAVYVTVQSEYAWPQTEGSATASFSKLQSQAEQGDAVAQYNLAISYLRGNSNNGSTHGSANGPSNGDYQSALKWLRA